MSASQALPQHIVTPLPPTPCMCVHPSGSATFNKGVVGTPVLRHPLTQLTGSLAVDGDSLAVSSLEAKVGPKGNLAVRGTLPLTHTTSSSSSSSRAGGSSTQAAATGGGGGGGAGAAGHIGDRLHACVSGVELRVRNVYSGCLDADLDLRGSLSSPVLGGRLVFSKGTAFLVPPAGSASGPEPAAAAASSSSSSQVELVRTAFAALKAGRARAATAAAVDARPQVGVVGAGGGVQDHSIRHHRCTDTATLLFLLHSMYLCTSRQSAVCTHCAGYKLPGFWPLLTKVCPMCVRVVCVCTGVLPAAYAAARSAADALHATSTAAAVRRQQ
jgi:hypothetical protein